jgi:hypothetical protein
MTIFARTKKEGVDRVIRKVCGFEEAREVVRV